MQMSLIETSIYVRPELPVEFVAMVDGVSLRIAIEWPDVERLIGATAADEGEVRNFVHRHKTAIALAIQAYLSARGIPMDHQLTMSADDLRLVRELPLALAPAASPSRH
jgi:hypothetical protein